tara:strand:+ start:1584 stop:2204 length:621 start_codon:yes stop_codon:yes gene_type:complete
MNLLTQNAKMKKTSTENNARIYNFSIPAYKTRSGKITCPFADTCIKYCYAQKGNYTRFPKIQQLMEEKYKITKQDNFILLMNEEIQKKKATHIRIHDSGDFYSIKYLIKWIDIATQNKDVIFYAYTKSIPFFKGAKQGKPIIKVPSNLKIIFSEGSKRDILINNNKDRHARIFKDVTTLLNNGYIDASNNDLLAITDNKKVGLVYH